MSQQSETSLWGDDLPAEVTVAPKPLRMGSNEVNPCIGLYGRGPANSYCRGCDHLLRVHHHDATYRKCELRKATHGKGSDHKASWPACARWTAETGPRTVDTEDF